MIILCWVCLGICVSIKLFGGNYFEIVVTNTRFISICEFIDSTPVFLKLLQFVVYFTTTWLYYNTLIDNPSKLLNLWYIVQFGIKFISPTFSRIIELISAFIIPMLYKIQIRKIILIYVMILAFQLISIFLRSISGVVSEYSLVGLVMSIDHYIMLILLFLYSKGETDNGLVGNVLFQ